MNQKEGFTMKDIIPPSNSAFYKPNAKNPMSNVLLTEILTTQIVLLHLLHLVLQQRVK